MQNPRTLVRCARSPHRRGAVLILVALLLIVFLGFLGLAVDTLYAVRTAQQLQAAADASALAGVRQLNGPQFSTDPAESAVIQAVEVADQNSAASRSVALVPGETYLNGDVVIGRYHRQSTSVPTAYFEPTLDKPNAVKVVANRIASNPQGELDLLFGPMFKVDSIDLTRDAIAMVGPGAAILVLDPRTSDSCPCSLGGKGTVAKLDVQNGAVQINSPANTAFCHTGNQVISADAFSVVGGVDKNFDKQVDNEGEVRTGQDPLPDPLAFLQDHPIPPGTPDLIGGSFTGNQDKQPGYYSQGIHMTSSGTLTLHPGIYVMGNGFEVKGSVNVQGPGVLIYLMGGALYLGGSGTIHLTEYTGGYGGGIYNGLVIWQAFGNYADATIGGTGNLDLQGTLYFPESGKGTVNGEKIGVSIQGTGGNVGTQLIAYKLTVQGTGTVNIAYDGRNNNMTNVFLVE
jgi:Flp pilus assembly protein TadG